MTSPAFSSALMAAEVRISMDGRGCWMDDVFIERLWRSLKHANIYLKGYADGREAHAGIAAWITFYNRACQPERLGRDLQELCGVAKVKPGFDPVIGGLEHRDVVVRAHLM